MQSPRASIDLGTNTCLLLIADWDAQSKAVTRVVEDHARVVRLGQGVDSKRRLHPEAMERTFRCLTDYAKAVREQGIEPRQIRAVATSQARDSADGPVFFDRIKRELGIEFRVLSGDEEARYTFLGGLLPDMVPDQSVVIDIGGGSTELMGKPPGAKRLVGQSLDIGSVRFTERYLKSDPVTDAEFWACQTAVDEALGVLLPWRKTLVPEPILVGVAGTATTLAAWHLELRTFDARKIDGLVLHRGDIHRMVEELKWRTIAERKLLPGVDAGREDVLLAGAMILWRAMEVLRFKTVTLSTRGLRYGVIGLD